MSSFHEHLEEYRRQMQLGVIPKAYRGLMAYLLELRMLFNNRHPDWFVSGSLYPGVMDMTYFALVPASFKRRNLKTAIVFLHEKCSFEVWLSGYNRPAQAKYWKLIKASGWDKYRLVPAPQGADSILECVIAAEPDFGDLATLTEQVETAVMQFIKDVEEFLDRYDKS